MTKNQIEYLKLRETQRANRKQESLTESRDQTTRELGFATLGETSRHNRETESHNIRVLGEQTRHNMETESHNRNVLFETNRHNLQLESLESGKLEETRRHNQSVELDRSRQTDILELGYRESARHNVATETEATRSNLAKEAELSRSNLARERETERANQARELETTRSNRAIESLRERELLETTNHHQQQIGLGYAQVGATRERTAADTMLGYSRLAESARATDLQSAIQREYNKGRLKEDKRSHKVQEEISRDQLQRQRKQDFNAVVLEKQRQNEIARHNQELEKIQRSQNKQGWVSTTTGGLRDIASAAKSSADTARTIIPLFGGMK